jgi:hemerythrin-like metal-binding protein
MDIPAFDESLRTGLTAIDEQHIGLFELAARVCRMTGDCVLDDNAPHDSTGEPCGPRVENAVTEAVYGLVDYITEHFADEQQIMHAARYPLADMHAAMHQEMSRQVASFVVQFVNGDGVPAEQIALFFSRWLRDHIMRHDREFVGWLAAHPPPKPVRPSPEPQPATS